MRDESRVKIPVSWHVLFWGMTGVVLADFGWTLLVLSEVRLRLEFLLPWVVAALAYLFGHVVTRYEAPSPTRPDENPRLWLVCACAVVLCLAVFVFTFWVRSGRNQDILIAFPNFVLAVALAAQALQYRRRLKR